MSFYRVLSLVIELLQQEGRVTYQGLKREFGFDEAFLEDVRQELFFRGVASDEQGKGLVWTGYSEPTTAAEPIHLPQAAERRQVTVMFCDLVASTTLSQQLDPEDYRAVVRAYQEAAVAQLQSYEGYVAQYLGDGLMVYFGWPRAHEDATPRAVYASLALIEALGPLNDTHLEPQYGVRVQVRIGLHTGIAVIGAMGGGGRHEQLAMGDTPNIAARLQGFATPNTVAISAATARLIQGAFVLHDLGPHTLKGVVQPMVVYRVLRPVETHHDDQETIATGAPFLVGRDEEVGLLRRRWEQAKEGLGQVVLLSGEAGIGKSSLLEILRAQVYDEGLPRIAFRCSPYYQDSALYPVMTRVAYQMHLQRDDTPAAKLDKLVQGLQTSALPLPEIVPLFAALLSIPLDSRYAAPTLTPQQQKQQTLDALVAWLMAQAEQQPVLVAWEDLHWADPSTQEMLRLVVEQAPTVPMLHMLTYRPEFSPPWPTRSHMTPITLNRLERPQVEAMIAHLAGGKALPDEVVAHIVARTDGVPLYVEELTKMFLASDLLQAEAEAYVLTGPLATVAIPDTLQDSLMARLDQTNTAKEVAQLGAVVGREFEYEILQEVSTQDEVTLQAGLAALVAAELLYQRGRPPRARYIFKHALIQDAAYASLLRSTRQHYHRQIAQLLERRFAETVQTQPELLAHHYTQAGLAEPAITYWQRAAERANARAANTEAQRHLAKGLQLLATLPESRERHQSELTLQTILGRVLTAAKGYGDAEVAQVYTRARQLCRQLGDTPQIFPVLLGLSIYFVVRGELHTARELGEQLLSLAQRAQDPVLLVEAHYSLGVTCFWLGEFTLARDHLEQGIARYDPAQHPAHLALYGQDGGPVCLCRLAMVLWYLGYPEQALVQGHAALAMVQELDHPFSRAYVLLWLALLYNHLRVVQDTQKWADAATQFATEQEFPFWYTLGTTLRGWLLTEQGHLTEGIALMRQGLADIQAVGTEVLQAYLRGLLAAAYGKIHQPGEGLAVLAEALMKVNSHGERWPEAELHRLQGELLWQADPQQQAGAAEASLLQALDVARGQQAKLPELRATVSLCRLWFSQNKVTEARQLLADTYAWFTEGFDTPDLQEAKALLEQLVAKND